MCIFLKCTLSSLSSLALALSETTSRKLKIVSASYQSVGTAEAGGREISHYFFTSEFTGGEIYVFFLTVYLHRLHL